MKKVASILIIIIISLLLPGCYDYTDPDEKSWIMAVGLDKGKQNKLSVTVVIAKPQGAGGGGGGRGGGDGSSAGGEGRNFFLVTMEAPTLLSSLELLSASVDRRPDLSHTKWYVFSRELAEEDIGSYFASLARFNQFRRSATVVICEGRAEEFLSKISPPLEKNVGKYYELMHKGWEYTEFIPFDTFNQFYQKSLVPGAAAVTILAAPTTEKPVYDNPAPKPKGKYQAGRVPIKGGSKINLMGAAVFKGGKMVGTLNGNQLGIAKMFKGTFKRTIIDIPDPHAPDRYIIVDATLRQRPSIKIDIKGEIPQITAFIKLEGNLMSIQSRENYEAAGKIPDLEKAVEQHLTKDINDAVAKSQELEADIFGFGLHAKRLFRTWPEWESYKWGDKYSQAVITVNVDYKLRRLGLISNSEPLL